jgi:hypothetical protein
MIQAMRFRFWLETGMATITFILSVITSVWRDWIEIVFGIEPDGGNGSLEWLILGALAVVTITLFVQVRYEWRRARATIS